ncbi:MAG: trehalase family glycosidase, partial [Planctomycetota bacterium]|nr:trehalase family glycosidase [Planctomycetota bacterium]
ALNQNIFLWDTCFLTMFCNYAHRFVPGIGSVDNFYVKQHETGEICREINRNSGVDFDPWINRERRDLYSAWGNTKAGYPITYRDREIPQPPPLLTLDALNHPILAWAEQESLRITGDHSRIGLVYEPLVRYYRALQKYIRQGNGLYITDWASMDNSPRNRFIEGGGTAVDTSSEMVMFGNQLAEFAAFLGKKKEAIAFRKEADEDARLIREKMWDPEEKFFYDLTLDENRVPVKTIAGYWVLLSGVATPEQADALAAELSNPKTFGRPHRVPTLAADQAGYHEYGDYWKGAVWAPTEMMVVRGLERYGKHDLAREIAMEHLSHIGTVFEKTGTVWENYSAEMSAQGNHSSPDFVGWTGLGPILFLFEFAIGIKADAVENSIVWNVTSPQRVGIENFWFGDKTVDLVCEAVGENGIRTLKVFSTEPFTLVVHWKEKQAKFEVSAGKEISQQI